MLDAILRKHIDPPLDRIGRTLAALGASANAVTIAGLALGLASALLIALGEFRWALLPLLASRIADGLDGAVARATRRTDFGGFLDITSDFLFYGAVPFAFILADPARNATTGGFLLLSFYVNGASFLAYAAMAAKHGLSSDARGLKNLYYSGGLLEGSETIAFFVAICIFPQSFPILAGIFAGLCFLTCMQRCLHAYRTFS
ncbi:CDP-alcohol phosphatidyltransferase family protein [Amaricoccus macauensis]|uniref:CDP-alcohol phosphatidyltransferase family protein n=1 Tax=Amaricoccus macauensis TaxID=57001 RepID=UPI003C7ABFE3